MKKILGKLLIISMLIVSIFTKQPLLVKANIVSNDISNKAIEDLLENNRETLESDDSEITEEVKQNAEILKGITNYAAPQQEVEVADGLVIVEKELKWNGELEYTNKPTKIILHHIEASRNGSTIPIEDVHSWHLANGWTGIGYHFYITKDGTIYRGRPEGAAGAHARGFNTESIGISVEGTYNTETMTAAQKESVIKLGQYIRRKYKIDEVYGHGELMSTDCPGRRYPLNEIRQAIVSVAIEDTIKWEYIDEKWYCIDIKTNEKLTGWQLVKNEWYYMNNDGVMQVGWLKLNDTWYYLNSNGTMQTGWLNLNGKWYYLNKSGQMQTGWLNLNDTWYYLNVHGEMQVGWINLNGKWYYLNESGQMQTGWVYINNKWYYLYKSGEMAINTVIDGWEIDNNGVAKPI